MSNHQQGQSLIETIMALFVLVTGLAAGLSLAIYVFGSSSDVSRRILATNLAREGIEAARRLRDSNWIAGTLIDCGSGQFCYSSWLTAPYNISPSGGTGTEYRMLFDPSSMGNKWSLSPSGAGSDYRLYVQAGGGLGHTATANPTQFFRKISMVTVQSSAPYTATSPKVLVRSSVWWWDKKCPQITYLNPDGGNSHCKIVTEEFLTNWRNY